MNRDIKFRAWDKDEGMINVARLDIADGSLYKYLITGKAYDYWNNVKLMQYTGLKDMNDREIYEGDIIGSNKSPHYIKSIVYYKNGAFVRSYENGNIYLLYDLYIEDNKILDWEVIGDIYNNPELLN